LSTTLIKFEKIHDTFDEKWKKNPLLQTTIINKSEKNCGTFRGGGGKNLLSLMTPG
jgi:hypothetical protein